MRYAVLPRSIVDRYPTDVQIETVNPHRSVMLVSLTRVSVSAADSACSLLFRLTVWVLISIHLSVLLHVRMIDISVEPRRMESNTIIRSLTTERLVLLTLVYNQSRRANLN